MTVTVKIHLPPALVNRLWFRQVLTSQLDDLPGLAPLGRNQTQPLILTRSGSQRATTEHIGVQSLDTLVKVEKLDFPAMCRNGMVNQFDDLFGLNPAMRMKDQIHHSLLEYRQIERDFQIAHRIRVIRFVEMIGRPVTRDHTGKFPAGILNHIRIRIIFDGIYELIMHHTAASQFSRNVLAEFFCPIAVVKLFAWQTRIIRCVESKDRGIELQKISGGCGSVEYFREKAGADGIQRVATGGAEGDGPVVGDRAEQINTFVIGRFGFGQIPTRQQRTGVIEGVALDTESFLQPGLKLRIIWLDCTGHDDGATSINLFQSLQNRPQIGFVSSGVAHVVDGEDHHTLDPFVPHPLWRG